MSNKDNEKKRVLFVDDEADSYVTTSWFPADKIDYTIGRKGTKTAVLGTIPASFQREITDWTTKVRFDAVVIGHDDFDGIDKFLAVNEEQKKRVILVSNDELDDDARKLYAMVGCTTCMTRLQLLTELPKLLRLE